MVAVRNTLSDWNNQPPMSLSIERVSGPPNSLFSQLGGFAIPLLGPTVVNSPLLTALVSLIPPLADPPPMLRGTFTAVVMALGLSQEAKYIKVATTDPVTGERVEPNVLRNPMRNAEFLATQLQSAGYFDLGDDEALVVTITPNNARYFTVPVTNLWTITDDYRNAQTSLNNAQAVANPDGTYTFVISPTDPGVHNWVSTGGLNQGTISIRFQDLDPGSTRGADGDVAGGVAARTGDGAAAVDDIRQPMAAAPPARGAEGGIRRAVRAVPPALTRIRPPRRACPCGRTAVQRRTATTTKPMTSPITAEAAVLTSQASTPPTPAMWCTYSSP